MTTEFIKKFISKEWSWGDLAQNPCLTEEFVEQYLHVFRDWIDELSLNPSLSIQFFIRHWKWAGESRRQKDPLSKDTWNWENLSKNQSMTPTVVQGNQYPYWRYGKEGFSSNPSITPNFIKENSGQSWDWKALSANPFSKGIKKVNRKKTDEVKKVVRPFQAPFSSQSDRFLTEKPDTSVFKGTQKRVAHYSHRWIRKEVKVNKGAIGYSSGRGMVQDKPGCVFLKWNVDEREGDLLNGITLHVYMDEKEEEEEEEEFCVSPESGVLRVDSGSVNAEFSHAFRPLDDGWEEAVRTSDVEKEEAQEEVCVPRQEKEEKDVSMYCAMLEVGATPIEILYGEVEQFKGNGAQKVKGVQMNGKRYTVYTIPLRFSMAGTDSRNSLPTVGLGFHDTRVTVSLDVDGRDVASCFVEENRVVLEQHQWDLFKHQRQEYRVWSYRRGDTSSLMNNEAGLIWQTLHFNHPTDHILFRVLDGFGVDVDFRRISNLSLLLNREECMGGPGYNFLVEGPGDEPGNGKIFEEGTMYMFRFTAPNTSGVTGVVPHGTINLSRIDTISIKVMIEGAEDGEKFTVRAYNHHMNVFVVDHGMGALIFRA